MQLELIHITPYLPYKLEFIMGNEAKSKEPTIHKLMSIDVGLKTVNFESGNPKPLTEIKPVLKPIAHLLLLQDAMLVRWGGGLSEKAKVNLIKDITYDMLYSDFTVLQYDEVQFMLENHIDVFHLIDAGLAVELT